METVRLLAGVLLLAGFGQTQTLEELGGKALGAAQEGHFADAVLLYEQMLKLAPGSREVRYDLALALNRLGRNRESLTVLGKPVSSEELTLAGINHRTLGDLAAAERNLRAAFGMAPDASIAADFGMVLLDREKYDEAERVFRRYPNDVQSVLGLGLAAFARGRNAEAEKLFAAAAAREPEAADLRVSLGDVYFATDRFAEADAAYREAIRLEPRVAEYRVKAGRNALRLDKQAEAKEHFSQAVVLDPLQAEAHLELGRITGERRHLEAAAAADPTRGAAHYQLALLYRRLGLTELSSASMRRFEQIRKQQERPYRIDMTPAAVVVEGPLGEKRWGRYQFPTAYRMADGRIITFVHVEADSADSYGMARRTFVSSDDGLSWREDREAERSPFGLRLASGEWLRIDTTAALPVGEVQLPVQAGTFTSYGSSFALYKWSDLVPDLRRIFFQRFAKGAWKAESTVVEDAGGMRYVIGGKFPRIWWGDMEVMPDGALLAVTYPSIDAKGPPFHFASSSWRSADGGRTWRMLARIPYAPDEQADPKAAQRDGFTEPAFTRLRDGSLLAVLRTTDGNGVGPMYQTRSRDGGRTWSKPVVIAANGVLPRLLRLDNGVLVLVSGRPGVQMRFSRSGLGDDWSEPVDIVPATSDKLNHDSCGYTSLATLGGDSFLITYSWFQKPDAAGEPRKTVLSRRVRIAVRPAVGVSGSAAGKP
ncbi:MAG: tetratricopeptide repeat protein [Bryobacterales bacterium]|nr:tetratricopeptide repeat protein [Bryobacterales bacterium]